jgi:mono/diheme cytochrome c family protein
VLGFALVLALAPAAAASDEAALYRARCATCHGSEGRGDGPAAGLLSPRPRDFTLGRYKFRSTPAGRLPSVEDVARTIRLGLPGTSMPGYEDLLTGAEIESLARHVLGLARAADGETIARRPWRVTRAQRTPRHESGADLYAAAGCARCHGVDGTGTASWSEGPGPGAVRPPTNLAEPWTFRGGSDGESIVQRILNGIDGSAMPAHAVSLDEARAIARHVRTLARAPIWEEREPARIATAGVTAEPLRRGRYLVHAMQCPLCHTPISAETGAYDTAYFLAGGMRVSAYPWGVWYSRNLTSDGDTGLGRWTETEIVAAITRGVSRDGRRLHPMAMPWPWFSRLSASDAQAIAAYLRSLPPVVNDVPEAHHVSVGAGA